MSIQVNQRLMFVGLGGTGINATIELEKMIRKEMCGPDGTALIRKYPQLELLPYELPKFIQTILIDTDSAAIGKHRNSFTSAGDEVYFSTTTQIADLAVAKGYSAVANSLRAQMPENVKTWLPESENEPDVSPISAGAGQYPLVGRAALFSALQPSADSFLANFDKAIDNISRAGGDLRTMGPPNGPANDIYIYVSFSVAGGTGTGIYYDILHLLEERARTQLDGLNLYMFPLVLMPKSFEEEQLDLAYRFSKLNGGFAISDLADLITFQRTPKANLESKFTQTYPGDFKVRIGGSQTRKRAIPGAFLFTKGPNAQLSDMYKSIAAFCLSNIGGDVKQKGDDKLTFFSDLVNHPEIDFADSAGPGNKPLFPALGTRLSIPVENISNYLTTYFVAEAVQTGTDSNLYNSEKREEETEAILRNLKFDFILGQDILPEGTDLPSKPKTPTSTKDAKELARKVVEIYEKKLEDIDIEIKSSISSKLQNIKVEKIIEDVLKQNPTFSPFSVTRALIGTNNNIENSALTKIKQFITQNEPDDKKSTASRVNKKNFDGWFGSYDKFIRKQVIPHLWAKHLGNDALYKTKILNIWEKDIDSFNRDIKNWANQKMKDMTIAKLSLDRQGELVKDFLPQIGDLPQVYAQMVRDFENSVSVMSNTNPLEKLSELISKSDNTWSSLFGETISSGNLNDLGLRMVDTIEPAMTEILVEGAGFYFDNTQKKKPLVPTLKNILSSVNSPDDSSILLTESRDQLKMELAGLIGPGGLPNNDKYENVNEVNPVVRVIYPADVKDEGIEQWIQKELETGGPLGSMKGIKWDFSVSQGNSIVVSFVIMSHGVLGNKDSFESLKLAHESNLTGAAQDKLPWRRRLGTTNSQIIGNESDTKRMFLRLLIALYTGQGELHTENGPAESLEDFANIESFIYKNTENANALVIPLVDNLSNSRIPSFDESMLNFQFESDQSDLIKLAYFNGTTTNGVPEWLTTGSPPKPKLQFKILTEELRLKEIKFLEKQLQNDDLAPVVKNKYQTFLKFWNETFDLALAASIVPERDSDGKNSFNTLEQVLSWVNSQ